MLDLNFLLGTLQTVPLHSNIESNLTRFPPLHVQSHGILSIIEFVNSPYLSLTALAMPNIIIIVVLSKAVNIEVRDAIRRTWGFNRSYFNNGLRVKILFLVGTDDFMTNRVRMEQVVFDDVIQVTIPDMYSFVAYKELAAMKWVRTYLPEKLFYIKTEEHVIINMKVFVDRLLPLIESASSERLIIGWFGADHIVQRGTYQRFIDAVIPPTSNELHYAMSLMYAVTASGADLMLHALNNIESIEYPGDPFVTGILRDAAQVKITNLAKSSINVTYNIANGMCRAAFEKDTQLLLCTTSLHVGSSQSMPEYFDAWNILIGQK
jgi:hypothetical protein